MNKIEIIAADVIIYLKNNNYLVYQQNLLTDIENLKDNEYQSLGILIDFKLIEEVGGNYRLTAKGINFESFEKLRYEEKLKIDNLEANLVAAKRSYRLTIAAIIIAALAPIATVLFSEYVKNSHELKRNHNVNQKNYMGSITIAKDTIHIQSGIINTTDMFTK
jgi:hypothetical protein